jgi:hypothetical protein
MPISARASANIGWAAERGEDFTKRFQGIDLESEGGETYAATQHGETVWTKAAPGH